MSRLREVALGVDQLLNAILGGYASETISSRAWRLRDRRPFRLLRPLIDGIFFWQPGHCKASYENQKARRNMPADYQL
ncbi:MAG: hypothetical protein ABIT83_17580 [Massilia sp.]